MPAALDDRERALLQRSIYVLVRVGEEFLAPYVPAARARILDEGGYGPAFPPLLERTLAALAAGDWPGGSYFPGGWYRSLAARGVDPAGVALTRESLGPFYSDEVVVEADGRWRVGRKWIEGAVLRFFLRNLHFDPDLGRYLIRYRNVGYFETRYLRHESPPFRVVRVWEDGRRPLLELNDGTREPLRPETLRLDGQERLYAAIKAHDLPALFERSARWQLLDRLEQDGAGWRLLVRDQAIPLRLDAPRPYAGEA